MGAASRRHADAVGRLEPGRACLRGRHRWRSGLSGRDQPAPDPRLLRLRRDGDRGARLRHGAMPAAARAAAHTPRGPRDRRGRSDQRDRRGRSDPRDRGWHRGGGLRRGPRLGCGVLYQLPRGLPGGGGGALVRLAPATTPRASAARAAALHRGRSLLLSGPEKQPHRPVPALRLGSDEHRHDPFAGGRRLGCSARPSSRSCCCPCCAGGGWGRRRRAGCWR
jgi:hypothetical protein